ncbi:MAG: prepilin-type N-terminal cleavage/methylation domain-containing protein [Patescibacteria group bacterium]|nr:prepilin-type N-terminal cleavage/methylation domain-containing protein [Patescibacteria group bacterium]
MIQKSKENYGFTLIELIIVFSVIAILSIIGIAAFASYSRTQALNAGVLDVVTMLNLARSRASSQVKPKNCEVTSLSLNGYEFTIVNNTTYRVSANCGVNQPFTVETKPLPKGVTFADSSLGSSVLFYVISGGVNHSLTITINESGIAKKDIVIDSIGSVSVKNFGG